MSDPPFGIPVAAKCVVFTAGHRDGWANWNSDLTPWNAVDRGPKSDLVGELGAAVRKRGLKYAPSREAWCRWDFQPFAGALMVPPCDSPMSELAGDVLRQPFGSGFSNTESHKLDREQKA